MTHYVEIDSFITNFNELIEDVTTLEQLKTWSKTDDFRDRLQEDSEDETTQFEILKELISILEKYEKEIKDAQLAKFQTLELTRKAAMYALSLENKITGNNLISDESYAAKVQVRECAYIPCGITFIADPPSKQYCSDKCREKAKKWRRKHN